MAVRTVGEPLIRLAVQPEALIFLLIANAALLLVRVGSVAAAYQIAVDALPARKAVEGRPLLAALTLTVLLAVTAAPHLAVAQYGLSSHDLLTSVFVDRPAPQLIAAAPVTPAEDTTTSTTLAPVSSSTSPLMSLPVLNLTPVSDPSIDSPPAITPFTEQHKQITILLIGGDAGPGRGGLRTDTMIVATLEPQTGKAALFSLPRNLGAVPLPRTFSRAFEGGVYEFRLNHLYGWATDHPWYFPGAADPGAEALMQTIGGLLDLPIDYFAVVDLGGFVDLVDALGGVDLYVPEPILERTSPAHEGEEWTRIDLKAGFQHLTGDEALVYARSRSTSSDYARMDRQRCLLGALAEQADPFDIAIRIPSLVPVIKDVLATNIPLGHLPDLAEAAAGLDLTDIVSVRFIPPTYTSGHDEFGHPIPRVARIQDTVRQVLAGTFDDVGSLSPADLASACG
jgi:LCP family protein required for cell wall assembly